MCNNGLFVAGEMSFFPTKNQRQVSDNKFPEELPLLRCWVTRSVMKRVGVHVGGRDTPWGESTARNCHVIYMSPIEKGYLSGESKPQASTKFLYRLGISFHQLRHFLPYFLKMDISIQTTGFSRIQPKNVQMSWEVVFHLSVSWYFVLASLILYPSVYISSWGIEIFKVNDSALICAISYLQV